LRGNPTPGIASCDAALALGPSPYDAAMVRAARGYGLVRAGAVAAGVAELDEAVTWFARSQLPFTRLFFTAWLGEGLCRCGDRDRARAALTEVLVTSQELGYRYTEGLAHRLLAEATATEPPLARRHLEAAEAVFRKAGAADTLARLAALRGELEERGGDSILARSLIRQALEQFERLGTLDEAARARQRLVQLDARGAG
jgi:tetratricopeptide (TPR) repeat protein